MKYYYCTETDTFISLADLEKLHRDEYKNDAVYGKFQDYLHACMYKNGGTLIHVSERLAILEKELYECLHDKCDGLKSGYLSVSDDLDDIESDISTIIFDYRLALKFGNM